MCHYNYLCVIAQEKIKTRTTDAVNININISSYTYICITLSHVIISLLMEKSFRLVGVGITIACIIICSI